MGPLKPTLQEVRLKDPFRQPGSYRGMISFQPLGKTTHDNSPKSGMIEYKYFKVGPEAVLYKLLNIGPHCEKTKGLDIGSCEYSHFSFFLFDDF